MLCPNKITALKIFTHTRLFSKSNVFVEQVISDTI